MLVGRNEQVLQEEKESLSELFNKEK